MISFFRQALPTVIATTIVGIAVGYGSFQFGQGQLDQRMRAFEQRDAELAQKDAELEQSDSEILSALQRLDREGTQISRQGAQQLAELKIRFDRLESQQSIAIGQNARVEALLLDLKKRLNQ
jgi:hypothetical protein